MGCSLQGVVESIVDGLFSALVTLGTVPIIKCPKVSSNLTSYSIECALLSSSYTVVTILVYASSSLIGSYLVQTDSISELASHSALSL